MTDREHRIDTGSPVTFTYDEIDEMVCELGAPEYRKTDDGEAWYWCFSGSELPVADTLAELLYAAKGMSVHEPWDDDEGDLSDGEQEYCFECNNMGVIPCECGGDICVCMNNGEMPCPYCER